MGQLLYNHICMKKLLLALTLFCLASSQAWGGSIRALRTDNADSDAPNRVGERATNDPARPADYAVPRVDAVMAGAVPYAIADTVLPVDVPVAIADSPATVTDTWPETVPVKPRHDAGYAGFDMPSRHCVGGLIGPLYLGATWKARPREHFAVQTDLVVQFPYCIFFPFEGAVWGTDNAYNGIDIGIYGAYINVNFLYNSHRLGRQFDWFIGGGVRAGYQFGFVTLGGGYGGVDFMTGFDWHSRRVPLDVSFDIRPFVGVMGYASAECFGMFDLPITVSLRRRF